MNLKEMREFLEWQLRRESQSGTFDQNLNRIINLAARYHSNVKRRWNELLTNERTFSTTASTDTHLFADDEREIFSLWHQEYTNRCEITIQSTKKFYSSYLSTTDTDIPEIAMIVESSIIQNDPTSASIISLTSSSNSDTSQKIRIYGLVSSYPDSEVVTLNGTSARVTTKSFSRIDRITIDGANTGRVTGTSNSGAVTNFVIPVDRTGDDDKRLRVRMWPIPDASYTIYYSAFRKQPWMRHDTDSTILGPDHDMAIIALATWFFDKSEKSFDMYEYMCGKLIDRERMHSGEENLIYPGHSTNFVFPGVRYGPNYPHPFGT